jgi:hypothetical protein
MLERELLERSMRPGRSDLSADLRRQLRASPGGSGVATKRGGGQQIVSLISSLPNESWFWVTGAQTSMKSTSIGNGSTSFRSPSKIFASTATRRQAGAFRLFEQYDLSMPRRGRVRTMNWRASIGCR